MSKKSFWFWTLGLALINLLIHFLTATNYELHRDEMLYFSMGNHLSWGFASTPPMMSFLSFIVIHLFGYHEFFVKLFPALAGSGLVILIALFIREIGGKRLAVITGCLGYILSTGMLRTASLFMPVIFELFFWMLFLFFVLKLIRSQNPKYWLRIGVCFGLAFLNKYSILFLGFGTLLAFLVTRYRKLLVSRYLIYAIGICFVIILPNVIWQITHNFAVATHMRALYQTQLVNVSVQTFLGEQLLMNISSILIWLPGLIGVLFIPKERRYRIFGYILILIVLLFLAAKGKPYYTLGVYTMMFAFGGYILENYLPKLTPWILAISLVLALFTLPFGLPVLPQESMKRYCAFFSKYVTRAPMRNEDGAYYPIPQDYMDMTGWDEVARLASVAYNELTPAEKKNCIVYANNYGQAGALDFYGKRYHLPSPVSVADSWIFWAPDSLVADNFIITDDRLGDIPRLFESYKEIGEVDNDCFRENGLKVFLCKKPTPLLNQFFRQRIREHRRIYGQ